MLMSLVLSACKSLQPNQRQRVNLVRKTFSPLFSLVQERNQNAVETAASDIVVASKSSYGADQITVLQGLDPVRKRPGMYIGSTGPNGLHHLVWEVVDNCVDEALSGYAKCILVTMNEDGSITVTDNGRGIPTDIHPVTGKSALEKVFTVLHAGGTFNNQGDDSRYKVLGGLHGVGILVVNALSEFVEVRVSRNNLESIMNFERGIPTGPFKSHSGGSPVMDASDINEQIKQVELSLEREDSKEVRDKLKKQKENMSYLENSLNERKSGTSVTFIPNRMVFKDDCCCSLMLILVVVAVDSFRRCS
jgi:DNA gyrase/topoisomerase IV subunit B